MADKPGGKSKESPGIKDLRAYFSGLNTAAKKKFILNLRQKMEGGANGKYKNFLAECIRVYNQEVKALKKETSSASDDGRSDLASELFAKAIASMLASPQSEKSPAAIAESRLVGTWQRESDGSSFYFKFNDDGSFETNEIPGHESLKGLYKFDSEGVLHIEPHGLLMIDSLTLSVSGKHLIIGFDDGSSHEYKAVGS